MDYAAKCMGKCSKRVNNIGIDLPKSHVNSHMRYYDGTKNIN